MMRGQQGLALVIVLLFLVVGRLALVPTLRYASASFKLLSVSRESSRVEYAQDALTQQALWYLQYQDAAKFATDCDDPVDGVDDSFADCVAKQGSWTLVTPGKVTGAFNETQVDAVNGQEVTVRVEVPGAMTAPPEPTPTPSPADCLFDWVTRDPTWVQIGEPVEYTIHLYNCSSSPAAKDVRRIVALLAPEMEYVADTSGGSIFNGWPPATSKEPEVSRCDGSTTLPDPDYPGCQANDNSLFLAWPDATGIFGGQTAVKLGGGDVKVLSFQATPQSFGVFYVSVYTCYFAANASACDTEIAGIPIKKKAPVVVGMFNIQGKGRGHAFGASSKLDNGGSALISQQPQ